MVLTLNQVANAYQVVLADLLHGFLVSLEGVVFTALGFVEHRFFVLAREHGFHIDPAAVQITGNAGRGFRVAAQRAHGRSEEHTSELQSLMRISYAVFCLKKKNAKKQS